jgi:hypothetical protein
VLLGVIALVTSACAVYLVTRRTFSPVLLGLTDAPAGSATAG